jgi:carboxypeptidase family protein/photosynthesis system II assembly factor YCF48-like protein
LQAFLHDGKWSKMKDESARDKAIEKVLAEKLRARAAPGNGCPDAEIIAAYFERSLAPKERLRWEGHFDSCAQCQHRIAALVRMDEAGEASLTHPSAKPVVQPRKTFALRWAWAAPLLLVVLVAGLWYTGELGPVLNRHTETRAPAPQPAAGPAKQVPTPSVVENSPVTTSTPPKTKAEEAPPKPAAPAPAQVTAADKLQSAASRMRQLKSEGAGGEAKFAAPAPLPPTGEMSRDRKKDLDAGTARAEALNAVATDSLQKETAQPIVVPPSTDEARVMPKSATQSAAVAGAPVAESAPPAAAPQAGREASGGGAAGGLLSKAENAPPQPQASTTALEAQPLREAAGPKAEARAERSKAGQSFATSLSMAQGLFGTVRGDVKDGSGAAIPGATIIVINTKTNVARVITTDDAGAYVADKLNPGDYTIQASARGFESSVMNDVKLQPRADRKVDFGLQVGSTAQTVEVQGRAPVVRTAPPVWRVGPGGLIQKRDPENRWEIKTSGVSVDLLDITFPSQDIGWAVGRIGTVLRSADAGESWGRVTSPTSEDLVRVRATSVESAEVTTRRGIVFVTTDGAATWTRAETAR